MWLIILIITIIALWLYLRIRKIPRLGNMSLITGGIKTGKSTLSVYLALRTLRRQRFKWHIKRAVIKILGKLRIKKFRDMPLPERPLLYSNIPIKTDYVPLTRELLLREERFNYGSVVYVCEASLVADSMSWKGKTGDKINDDLLLLNKLFAHETKGGYIFYDTQSISDNHYAIRRCLSSYLYVHHTLKVPFFLLMWVRELKYSEEGTEINTFASDIEDDLKLIVVPKRVWKRFDCYCYSILTDDLDVRNEETYPFTSLKAEEIISFKEWKNLRKRSKKQ